MSASDENSDEEFDMQVKTIPLHEYNILMDLIPEVEKLRNTVKKLTVVIEMKDSKLKEQEQLHKAELAKCINISHFSAVSIYFNSRQKKYETSISMNVNFVF